MPENQPDTTLQEPEVAPDVEIFYANYVAVTATPEEVVLRWCLRDPQNPAKATERFRVYITLWHAKRLLFALAGVIKANEDMFGPVESERAMTAEGQKKFDEAKKVKVEDAPNK